MSRRNEDHLMFKRFCVLTALVATAAVATAANGGRHVALGDWPDARCPHRSGVSDEKGLIDTWELNGRNLLWRVPYGGRSAPIALGTRVIVQAPAGLGAGRLE